MGTLDTLTTNLMKDNKIFADAFNFALFDGRPVIDPEQLVELDTSAIAIPFKGNGIIETNKRLRDVFKLLTVKTDGKRTFVLLGSENQGFIHYAMPVKDMLYDAINYSEQVVKIGKFNRENGYFKDNDATKSEYLSGLLKTDKIHPIITLVIYFGADEWDGPLSLHEMFDVEDESFLRFVPDYRINLITPNTIDYEEFDKFQTILKKVLLYIKLSADKNRLTEEVQSHPDYWTVDPAIGKLMNVATGSKLKLRLEGGMISMRNAIDEIKEESIEKGIEKGRKEGIETGKKEGIEIGETKTLIGLVKDGLLSLSAAAKRKNMTEAEFAELLGMQKA